MKIINDYGTCEKEKDVEVEKCGWWDVSIEIDNYESHIVELFEDEKYSETYMGPISQYLEHNTKEHIKDLVLAGYSSGSIGETDANWSLSVDSITLDGAEVGFRELSEISQEHILDSIMEEGNFSGEVVEIEYEDEYTLLGIGDGVFAPKITYGTIDELYEMYVDDEIDGNSSLQAALCDAGEYDKLDIVIENNKSKENNLEQIIKNAKTKATNNKDNSKDNNKEMER